MRTGFGVGERERVRLRERERSRLFGGGVRSTETRPPPRRRGERERLAERERSLFALFTSPPPTPPPPPRSLEILRARSRDLVRLRCTRSRSRSDSLRVLLLARGDLVALRGERELSLPVAPAPPLRRFFSLRSVSLVDEDEELDESLELLELERESEPELLRDEELPDELWGEIIRFGMIEKINREKNKYFIPSTGVTARRGGTSTFAFPLSAR